MVAKISNILSHYTEDKGSLTKVIVRKNSHFFSFQLHTNRICQIYRTLQGSLPGFETQEHCSRRGAAVCLTFSLLVLYVHILIFTLDFPGTARSPNGVLKEPTYFLDEKVLSYDAEKFKLQPGVYSVAVKLMCHGACSYICAWANMLQPSSWPCSSIATRYCCCSLCPAQLQSCNITVYLMFNSFVHSS